MRHHGWGLRGERSVFRHLGTESAKGPFMIQCRGRPKAGSSLTRAAHPRAGWGAVVAALRVFRLPLLPTSTAPGEVRLGEYIEASMRQAVLDNREPDLMSTWTLSPWGADDYDTRRAQLDLLGPAPPLRPLAAGSLARARWGIQHCDVGPGTAATSLIRHAT
jgi:hypothetical protein